MFPFADQNLRDRGPAVFTWLFIVIGMWALLQFINGFGRIAFSEQTGGVAYLAHIGGFLAGVAFGLVARSLGRTGARVG